MAFSSFNSRISAPGTGANGFIPGDITNISFSGISATEIDVTALTSTGKTFVLGTRDPGTVTITTMANILTANLPPVPVSGGGTGAPYTYTVYFGGNATTGLKFVFTAFIISTTMDAAVDSAVGVTYTLQITGAITISYS
jgi:hypothetical protein